jgi:phosphoribosylformimino-5-aminoimidazole carboxamide ribotide isomerase
MNFEKNGFKRLHLVDLDGAKAGKVINSDVLKSICQNTSLEVDFGGGIKTDSDLEIVFEAGAKQVTIGSLAVKDLQKMKEWIMKYGADKFILGADVKDGKIAIGGWLETSDIDLVPFVKQYFDLGIRTVLCTDISKDGMLTGPAFELYAEIMKQFPDLNLIASGGVSCIEDIEKLADLSIPSVVVGKAIYEEKIDLIELQKLDKSC